MSSNLAIDPNLFSATRDVSTLENIYPRTWATKARFASEPEHRAKKITIQFAEREFEVLAEDEHLEDLIKAVIEKFNSILNLDENWDSYNAPAISPKNVETAFEIVLGSFQGKKVLPEIFPTPLGGIEIRWANLGKEFEIEINEARKFEALYCEGETCRPVEGRLDTIAGKSEVEDLIQKVLG